MSTHRYETRQRRQAHVPTTANELVDFLRDHEKQTLVLRHVIRFPVRSTRNHPYDFSTFLSALRESTVTDLEVHGDLSYGWRSEEWELFLATIGNMRNLQKLCFMGNRGPNVLLISGVIRLFQNNILVGAQLSSTKTTSCLEELIFNAGVILYGFEEEWNNFTSALSNHPSLRDVSWHAEYRNRSRRAPAPPAERGFSYLNSLFQALSTCTCLCRASITMDSRTATSSEAVQQLAMVRSLQSYHLEGADWRSLNPVLQESQCQLRYLSLWCREVDEDQARSLGTALMSNTTLQHLVLSARLGLTDTVGEYLGRALLTNRTLQTLQIASPWQEWTNMGLPFQIPAFGTRTYKAMAAALSVNHNVRVELPSNHLFRNEPQAAAIVVEPTGSNATNSSEEMRAWYGRMRIEMILNQAGRGSLFSHADSFPAAGTEILQTPGTAIVGAATERKRKREESENETTSLHNQPTRTRRLATKRDWIGVCRRILESDADPAAGLAQESGEPNYILDSLYTLLKLDPMMVMDL